MADIALASPSVTVCRNVALAMILLRRGTGPAASRALHGVGLELPTPGRFATAGDTTLLWAGPDRFVAVQDDGGNRLADGLRTMLDEHAYVAEAASSRTVLQVSGPGAAEWLGRWLPIDLHPRGFEPGCVALTIAAHVPVQVWRPAGDCFRLACPASFGASFHRWLAAD